MTDYMKMHKNNLKDIIRKNKVIGSELKTNIVYNEDGIHKTFISNEEIASLNAFFFMMCDKLSKGEIIDLAMEITRKVYGMYPNVTAIKAMAKKYGYDLKVDI